jgi:hypothetical protein
MRSLFTFALITCAFAVTVWGELTPEQKSQLPQPANRPVDFAKDIKPLFEAACVKCHAKGKDKGGFSLETRERFLNGGDTGAAAVVGKSEDSYLVELVSSSDSDEVMPKKGTKWTREQIGLMRAWIDQGATWPANISFAKPEPQNLHPHTVALPDAAPPHPIDKLLAPYFAAHGITPPDPINDRVFARRVYLDLIGLLPTPAQLASLLADAAPDKRDRLVRALLADRRNYADHWLTFWNDLLRNDYKGTGFIDGGRKQITGWLHTALVKNLPYDKFVAQLINPGLESEGFSRGIIWRGNVNAAMLPPMQAAQNVSQVFLGVNLKCASCHDSFINDWALSDAYGLAAVYAEEPLELVHCDKPTGKKAAVRFLYPEIGALDAQAEKPQRLARLAEIITSPEDGRLSRTIVNRLWARLLGRGLVEPLDDMDQPAWQRDLLDWLAEDLVAHHYDLQRTLEVICTSRAYQLPTVEGPKEKEAFVFRGPLTRRLTAEQFSDAISALTGEWSRVPASFEFDFRASGLVEGVQMPKWIWTDEPLELAAQRGAARSANAKLGDAASKLAVAQKEAEVAATKGGDAIEKARLALEQATAAMSAAQEQLQTAAQAKTARRHEVIFRKKLTLAQVPNEAWATLLASQRFEVQVNGREAKAKERDGAHYGRIALFDLKPLLAAGDNIITIDVSSHTEKGMNDIERQKYPASTEHLNKQSGLAFYLRCLLPGAAEPLQITSDETWRVQRNPAGAWNTLAFSDADWAVAQPLPGGVTPVDEGPGLVPISRKDFANIPVELGSQLSPAVSMVAIPGKIRAALLSADPLQVALDRPNREVVVPARAGVATTMQALELTNGATLDSRLKRAAAKFASEAANDSAAWLDQLYLHALSRPPAATERELSLALLGNPPTPEAVADLLWALLNLPEFQLIR